MPRISPSEDIGSSASGLTAFASKLVNLLALLLIQERQQTEQIDLLSRAGFRPIEIAALLDTTANNVSVRLAEKRRTKKTGGVKGTKKK
jgi:hypothetical protein